MSTKTQLLQEKIAAVKALAAEMDASEDAYTVENREKADAMLEEIGELKRDIEREAAILGVEAFLTEPENPSQTAGLIPAGGDGANAEPFTSNLITPTFFDLGRDLIDSDAYKAALAAGIPRGSEIVVERKGYLSPQLQAMEARDAAIAQAPSGQKATLTTTGLTSIQWLPGIYRITPRLTVADLLAQGRTTAATIRYMQETAFVNAATTVAEGALKPEATFTVVEKDAPVRKIAVTAKVTDELFADYPAMRDYVNERLRLMLMLTEENQLLNGLGTGSEITGINVTSGINALARTTETAAEAIFKGANLVRNVGYLEPDGVVVNPTDWEKMRLEKDANDQYYAGGPFAGQYGNGGYVENPPLWGMRVVVTPAQTAGTALVGAFRTAAQVFYREGVRVDMTNSNVDDFVKNLLTIRCEERLALAVYRPKGFTKVTALP